MDVILTRDEVLCLSQFDSQIEAAVKGHYYRGIGQGNLETVNGIREAHTGQKHAMCFTCAADAYDLMVKVGAWYYHSIEHYRQVDEAEALKAARAALKKVGRK